MNTQEIADKLVKMCRNGQNMEVLDELYADTIVSREMPGMPGELTEGIKEVFTKNEQWLGDVVEFHSSTISDPQVAGNHFTCTMDFDVTFKSRGRQQMKEVCVYGVDNGKIVSEQFFYSM